MEQECKWPWGKLAGEGKGKREKNQVKLRDNLCRLAFSLAVVVEFLSHVRFFVHVPWTAACQALLFSTISWSFLKLISIESVMPSSPSHPLLSPSPPALNLSQHQGLSNELALCIRWPNYWSFSFTISTSNEYSVLISFRTDCFDLLAVQGILKNLLQHNSSKASVLQRLALFVMQLSHLYMITGKIIALTIWTFVS